MQSACRWCRDVEVTFSNVKRSTFPVPETGRGLIEEKGMVIWGVAGTVKSRSAVRGSSEPVNIDRCTMIRQHRERAGAQRQEIRGTTLAAQTERWDEVRGGSRSIVKPMRKGAPRTPTRSSLRADLEPPTPSTTSDIPAVSARSAAPSVQPGELC
jgi:hypothetical protein